MPCCTCGVKEYKECWNCGCCLNDECECTKEELIIGRIQQELVDLRERIEVLEECFRFKN